uniref:Uncharacterized protein n=1 Tax=Arundo donax TaxID=35708 RepID=A0A0A9HDI1_ARUDO
MDFYLIASEIIVLRYIGLHFTTVS